MKIPRQITFALLICLASSLAPALSAQTVPPAATLPETEVADAQLQTKITGLVKAALEENPKLDLSDPVAVQQAIEAIVAKSYGLFKNPPSTGEIQLIAETVMRAFIVATQSKEGFSVNTITAASTAIVSGTLANLPTGTTTSATDAIKATSVGVLTGAVKAAKNQDGLIAAVTLGATKSATDAGLSEEQAAAVVDSAVEALANASDTQPKIIVLPPFTPEDSDTTIVSPNTSAK
jgi:hypothetical protein